jgi:hypothetical protein
VLNNLLILKEVTLVGVDENWPVFGTVGESFGEKSRAGFIQVDLRDTTKTEASVGFQPNSK